jgi:mRNA interferase YafQ
MLAPRVSNQFKRDLMLVLKRGKDASALCVLMARLIAQQPLPASYKDHPLKGDWQGYRDAHIEADWLLIYRLDRDEVQFVRTGTHADIFGE